MKPTDLILKSLLFGAVILSANTDTMAERARIPRLRAPRVLSDTRWPIRQAFLYNDIARSSLDIRPDMAMKSGNEVIPFDGRGVVIGIIDTGIDPRHIAFQDPMTGKSRIALAIKTTSAVESKSGELEYKSKSPMNGDKLVYNDVDKGGGGHGTHTTGTAAGATLVNPYSGMAPGATLVLTSMGESMYNDEIAFGIKAALDYGRENSKPVVCSLSLGNVAGMHDGSGLDTDLLSEELSPNGQLVVYAAGNDADGATTLWRDFSAEPGELKTALYRGGFGTKAPGAACVFVGQTDDWQIAFTLVEIHDKYAEVWRSQPIGIGSLQVGEPADLLASLDWPAEFDLSEESSFTLTRLEGMNGRVGAELSGFFDWTDKGAPYTVGVVITSPNGGTIEGYASPGVSGFGAFGIEGYTKGDGSESISDNCFCPYVISVGAVNARASFTDSSGRENPLDEDYYGPLGGYAAYSSYGSRNAVLPHTAAPGTQVISSIARSSSYTKVTSEPAGNGEFWYWGESTGTSMATPAIAGMLALWLQANPDLTRDEVLDLLERTGKQPTEGITGRSRWGVPSCYEGLKIILGERLTTSTPGAVMDYSNLPNHLMLKYLGSEVEAVVPFSTTGGSWSLYATDGSQLSSGEFIGQSFTVPANIYKGIAILTVTTPQGSATQKLTF